MNDDLNKFVDVNKTVEEPEPDDHPVPEPKEMPPVSNGKKSNVFVRAFRTVTAPVRWCAEKIKNSPAAAGLGAVAGAGVALGGRLLIHAIRSHSVGDMDMDIDEGIEAAEAAQAAADVEEVDIQTTPFEE